MAKAAEKKKGSSVELIVALVILTIIGGGGGAVFAHLSQGNAKEPAKEAASKKSAKDKKADKSAVKKPAEVQPMVVSLPPIVANLEAPESRWVRFEASLLVVADGEPVSEELRHRVAQDLMARIRQFKLSEIEGVEGLLNLRTDLTELARIRTQGKALDLIINGLIVE